MEQPKVCILLSTFNGERYLMEQLQSIYEQDYPHIQIRVRDDGSHDKTIQLLENEQKKGKLTWYKGENKGAAWSFWDLLMQAPNCDYYAFADQDDFWKPEKISTVIRSLEKTDADQCALYFGQTQLADKQLKPISSVILQPKLTYGEALIVQFVGGCTMVFNHALRKQLQTYTPTHLFMHDFWIYNVALALDAKVVFDPTPHILYRQHGNNVIGQANSTLFIWRSRLKRLWENKHIRTKTAQDLWDGYHAKMSPRNRQITLWASNCNKSLLATWHLLTSSDYRTFSRKSDWFARISVLLRIF